MSAHSQHTNTAPLLGPVVDRSGPHPSPCKVQTIRRQTVAPVQRAVPVQSGAGPARRIDLLPAERGNDRIAEAQLIVGRMCQAVFERGSGARLG